MADPSDFYDHVIVGGGVAADKAARALRESRPTASVAILSRDADEPVYRPALSKDLWHGGDSDPASQDLATAADTGAELFTGVEVSAIDVQAHMVVTTEGTKLGYGTLLLATGSAPRRFEGVSDDRVVYLRSVADYRRLRELVGVGTRVAVVGGGYIGSEISAGLAAAGATVSTYFRGERLLEHMFPPSITTHVKGVFADHGIELVAGFELASIDAGEELTLTATNGERAVADVAVLGLGAVLNTRLAEDAGLELIDGAVSVDAQLRTGAPDVYAAGDIIHFADPVFGGRHIEHVDNAWRSGTRAGWNMAGETGEYGYTPLFYSDLFDDGYEAIGHLSTRFELVEEWNDEGSAAVIWYLDAGKVAGVLLWNTWDAVPKARELASASRAGELDAAELPGKIAPGS